MEIVFFGSVFSFLQGETVTETSLNKELICFTLSQLGYTLYLKLAIRKSRHWQLDIGISISIGIAKILVSAYEFFFFEKVEHLCPIRLNILRCA